MISKNKIVKAGSFLTLSSIIAQIFAIIFNVILARLLEIDDFGLLALSSTYIGFLTIFTNIGFGSAIIHKQNASHNQLSTLYWLSFLFSFISFILITLGAPFAANFYNEPKLKFIVWLSASVILLNPFFNTHYKIKERNLEFKVLSKITIITTFFGYLSSVIFAFLGFGVYSLVIQIIVTNILKLILVLKISDWEPKRIFNFNDVKKMIWYTLKYKGATGLLYIERNIDYLILGKIFSASTIGYYAFAYNIMYTPIKRITYIFNNVLFPSFSAIKDTPKKIIQGYFQSIQLISIISFPAMTILALNLDFIVPLIFGTKWIAAIPIVKILCFAGAIQSISQAGDVIFTSIGKPEVTLFVSAIRTIFVVSAIIIGSVSGIITVAYYLLIAKILSFILMMYIIYYFIPYSFTNFLHYMLGPTTSVVTLFLFEITSKEFLFYFGPMVKLFLMFFIALITLLLFHSKLITSLIIIIRTKTTEVA